MVPAALALAAFAAASQTRDAGVGEPYGFLRSVGGFSSSELAPLDRGEPVAKVLDTDKREVAVIGAVRVRAPRERLFDHYRDLSALKRSQIVTQAGTFSQNPRAGDLADLAFEDYDLETIRACRPGDCGVRLPAESMARFHRVDWSADDWRQRVGSVWRDVLAEYVAGYAAHGNRALAEYQNKAQPLSMAQEFRVLFDESGYYKAAAPEFFRYLEEFPAAGLEGSENLMYWTKESFGLRPVISLTHQVLYAAPPGRTPAAFIATKQIYASHYFDAALALSFVFEDRESGFYLLTINRARTRSLTSFLRGMVRSMVQKRSRDATEQVLRATKIALEQPRAK